MAEEKLSTVLGEDTDTFVDKNGVVHKLLPLDMLDYIDVETRFGSIAKLFDRFRSGWNLDDATWLIWLSTRREGLSEEAIDERKWPFTQTRLARWFKSTQLLDLTVLVQKIAVLNGWISSKKADTAQEEAPK